MKLYWLKNKKAILISLGVLFVVAIFFINSSSKFKNGKENESGLAVNTEVLGNLLEKDSDKDGILDWEEGLWSTDPNNKDTDGDGINDKAEIEQLKEERGLDAPTEDPNTLSQTDKFSQELFATVAALSQNGELDQASIDQISEALKQEIQSKTIGKIFTSSDITTTNNNSAAIILNYNNTLNNLSTKYQIRVNPIVVFQESLMEDGEIDTSVLYQLEPVVSNLEGLVGELLKVSVPTELATLHLNYTNSLQRLKENLDNIMSVEVDPLIALGSISKYEENSDAIEEAIITLNEVLTVKLSN